MQLPLRSEKRICRGLKYSDTRRTYVMYMYILMILLISCIITNNRNERFTYSKFLINKFWHQLLSGRSLQS